MPPPTIEEARAAMRVYSEAAKKVGATNGFATAGVSEFTKDLVPDLDDTNRDITLVFVNYLGKTYAITGLNIQQRPFVILSTLITQGALPELEIHNALKVVVTVFKDRKINIEEVGLQQAVLNRAKPLQEPGRVIMREYRDMGKALGATVGMAMPGGPSFAKDARIIAPAMRDIQEETGDWIYARPGFGKTERSLVIISSLITQGVDPEVAIHVHTGLNVGLTAREIVAIGWFLVPCK
ncbi:hypothetical protein HDU93_002333 [Gonapodya sp. JEL0774]|nr:hypothetical protein HDU93_002333 [Gonapodya sp. JEL0774]